MPINGSLQQFEFRNRNKPILYNNNCINAMLMTTRIIISLQVINKRKTLKNLLENNKFISFSRLNSKMQTKYLEAQMKFESNTERSRKLHQQIKEIEKQPTK